VAILCAEAPRTSWAGFEGTSGLFSDFYVDLYATRAFLIRYPIDQIPKGQRITSAEWTLPVNYLLPAAEHRLYVRRLLKEWGPGVSHQYRMVRPKKEEWAVPGARGAGSDRVAKASVVVRVAVAREPIVNVTEDVELWYSGAAANHGWILNNEDEGRLVRLNRPTWGGIPTWKLRITYEPSDDK
jgi:hypothetical protein